MTVFALQVLGLAGLVALAVAALLPLGLRLGARLSPAPRADLSFLLGLLPATVGGATLLSLALPSVLVVLGLGQDHCLDHGHGPHLCAVHGSTVVPALLALGAVFGGTLLVRGVALVRSRWRAGVALTRLQRLSHPLQPRVFVVPTDLPLCHAAGVLRPRVLISDRVDPAVLLVALAHEHAHLERRDTLQLLLLDLGALVLPGALATRVHRAFEQAADEVCDDVAAARFGPLAVAEALIRVARGPALSGAMALAARGLEQRVRRLLEGPSLPGRSLALRLGAAGLVLLAGSAAVGADALHHAVEHLLHPHI